MRYIPLLLAFASPLVADEFRPELIYSSNLKNWEFSNAELRSLIRRQPIAKQAPIEDRRGPAVHVSSQSAAYELGGTHASRRGGDAAKSKCEDSECEKTNSSSCLSIAPPKKITFANPKKHPFSYESFTYVRAGGICLICIPVGYDFAMGHRFHGKNIGFGPLVNISAFGFMDYFDTISFKFELLYFPKNCDGGYLGIMPGAGAMYANRKYGPFFYPSLELIYGQEFANSNDMPRFYYFSLNLPWLTFKFDYGWGF